MFAAFTTGLGERCQLDSNHHEFSTLRDVCRLENPGLRCELVEDGIDKFISAPVGMLASRDEIARIEWRWCHAEFKTNMWKSLRFEHRSHTAIRLVSTPTIEMKVNTRDEALVLDHVRVIRMHFIHTGEPWKKGIA